METINQRVNAVMLRFTRNQKEFAIAIKASQSRISNILTSKNKPDFDFIEKIAKTYPVLSLDWLILGNGSMLRDASLPDVNLRNYPQGCGCNRPIIIHLHKDSI